MELLVSNSKVVLITGAAKRIGACIATIFHSRGYRVLIHINESKTEGENLALKLNQIRENSAGVFQADFNDQNQIEKLAEDSLNFFGRLDVLINNASMFYPTPLDQAQQPDWDELFNSNVRAAFFLCRSLSSELRSRSGCIINIVDAHVDKSLSNHPIYNMAKSALKSMTKSLARDLGPSLRVNGVSPGAILWPPGLENDSSEASKSKKEKLLKEIPLQRLGKPEDIANVSYFLCENETYMTGQVIKVDGGRSLI
jgi:pteridine reductase